MKLPFGTMEARPNSGERPMELASLGALLGIRCVDALELENSVIDQCDTAQELQRQIVKGSAILAGPNH